MDIADKEYLMSHPLAFEILYTLQTHNKATSTKIANQLRRGLSTVWESLRRMEQNTKLIEQVERDEELDQRNTYFSVVNSEEVKNTLMDELVLRSYAKASSRLRREPLVLLEIFEKSLTDHLKEFESKRGDWFNTIVPSDYIGPSIRVKTSQGLLYIDVVKIRKYASVGIYESIGKIIDVSLAHDPIKILIVYLLSPKTSRAYEESIHRIFKDLSQYRMDVNAIIEFVNDEDLVNDYFIKKLSETIIQKIQVKNE